MPDTLNISIALAHGIINKDGESVLTASKIAGELDPKLARAIWIRLRFILDPEEIDFFKNLLTS